MGGQLPRWHRLQRRFGSLADEFEVSTGPSEQGRYQQVSGAMGHSPGVPDSKLLMFEEATHAPEAVTGPGSVNFAVEGPSWLQDWRLTVGTSVEDIWRHMTYHDICVYCINVFKTTENI